MRPIEIKDRHIYVNGARVRARWTNEANEDLLKFHGFDLAEEVSIALLHEINAECHLTDEEKVYYLQVLREHFKNN